MPEARLGVDRRGRAMALAGVAAIHIVAIIGLISAFSVDVVTTTIRSVAAFDVPLPRPEPPQPKPSPTPAPSPARKPERAAEPAPKAKARPLPRPPIATLPKPAPSPAATGTAERPGSAERGAGSGAGGQGPGAGGGGQGSGPGGGIVRRAQKLGGHLDRSDYPRATEAQRIGRSVVVRYDVGVDGRVRNCRVAEPSGSPEADAITCRLIEKRFRYRPAQDAQGNAVPDQTGWKQWWYL